MKYLALDILTLAGVPDPESKIGKVSVRIGGVVANEPNKVINVLGSEVEVIVARTEKYTFVVPETQSEEHAAHVRVEKERQGTEVSKPYFERESMK